MHEDEGQFSDELAADGAEVQLDFGAVAHHDAECVALVGVQEPATSHDCVITGTCPKIVNQP